MAEILGLSTTTVSNVIHGKGREVSESTRKQVMKIVKQYNYIPNINARNLASNNSKIIGIAVKDTKYKYNNVLKDTFASELIGAIEAEIRKNQYFTMFYVAETIDDIMKLALTWNVDGVVMIGALPDECEKLMNSFNKPIVFIDSYYKGERKDYFNVGLEDYNGAFMATQYLIDNGHKEICFVADNIVGVDMVRHQGYLDCMEKNKISGSENRLILIESNLNKINRFFQDNKDKLQKYTAFFCSADIYAVYLMNYLNDNGVLVPQDISVIGFDDSILAQNSRPRLTTVHQSPSDKGKKAIEYLICEINKSKIEKNNFLFPTKIIKGDTVKNING